MASYERKCPKCGGSGVFKSWRGDDTCWPCYGTGKTTVLTGEDKRRRDTIRAVAAKLYAALDARLAQVDGTEAFEGLVTGPARLDSTVLKAFGRLRDNEPDRLFKMADSIGAGRIDDVIRHLARY